VCREVLSAVSTWKSLAKKFHIANVEISLMETVFMSQDRQSAQGDSAE